MCSVGLEAAVANTQTSRVYQLAQLCGGVPPAFELAWLTKPSCTTAVLGFPLPIPPHIHGSIKKNTVPSAANF